MEELYMKQLSWRRGFSAKLAQVYTSRCPWRTALPRRYSCSGYDIFFPRHCFPTARVATTASSPNTSSTLLSSIVPQIFHFCSSPLNIILCKTTYSTIFFALVISLAGPFLGVLSRLCMDFILTTTWESADFSISSVTILVLTIRGKPIYLCNVHCRLSLGGRTLIRVRNESTSPSWQTLFRVVMSLLFQKLGGQAALRQWWKASYLANAVYIFS